MCLNGRGFRLKGVCQCLGTSVATEMLPKRTNKGKEALQSFAYIDCWISKTIAHSDGSVNVFVHRGQYVVGKIIYSLVMDVVLDFQKIIGIIICGVDRSVKDVFGVLDQSWAVIQITSRVQIEICVQERLANFNKTDGRIPHRLHDTQVSSGSLSRWRYTQNKAVCMKSQNLGPNGTRKYQSIPHICREIP